MNQSKAISAIPNIITLLNLFFGCLAIVFLLENGIVANPDSDAGLLILSPKIWMASMFIAIAAVVDFFDGFVARLFNASSEMGKQLDSLADVVSFGVAPGIIIYQLLRIAISKGDDGLEASYIWLLPAFILPCAAAYRLARFNIDNTTPSFHFRGVPVPAVGLTVAAFPLIFWHSNSANITNLITNKWVLYGIVFLLSWLMVSSIPIISNKLKNKTISGNLHLIILAVIAILSVVFLGYVGAPLTFTAFVLLSIIFKKNIL